MSTQQTYVCENQCMKGRIAAICCPVGTGSRTTDVCFIGLGGIRVLCGTVCLCAIQPQCVTAATANCTNQWSSGCRVPCGLASGGWLVTGGKAKQYCAPSCKPSSCGSRGGCGSSCNSCCAPPPESGCCNWSLEYDVVSESPMPCSYATGECDRPRYYHIGQGIVTILTSGGAVFQLLNVECTTNVLQAAAQIPWTSVRQSVCNLQQSASIVEVITPIAVTVYREVPDSDPQPLGPCNGGATLYAVPSDAEAAVQAWIIVWGSIATTIVGHVLENQTIRVDRAVQWNFGSGFSAYAKVLYPGDQPKCGVQSKIDTAICGPCCPPVLLPCSAGPGVCSADDRLLSLVPCPQTVLPVGIQYCGCPEQPVHTYCRYPPVQVAGLSAIDVISRPACSNGSSCDLSCVPDSSMPAASFNRRVAVVPYAVAVPPDAAALVFQPSVPFTNIDLLPANGDRLFIQLADLSCPAQTEVPPGINVPEA